MLTVFVCLLHMPYLEQLKGAALPALAPKDKVAKAKAAKKGAKGAAAMDEDEEDE